MKLIIDFRNADSVPKNRYIILVLGVIKHILQISFN